MRPLSELIRPNIARLSPYSSARDEFTGNAEVFLDANENPFRGDYNRYPDPRQRALKERIAAYRNVASETIFLGNGSDEAIDLLLRAFCRPGEDRIVICPPTYGMYQVAAGIQDAGVVSVPLIQQSSNEFQPDVPALLALSGDERNKLLFLCSPNNPTGNLIGEETIEQILNGFSGLVVLDEAYIDFAPGSSMLPRLAEFPNLVILQTFSKAWGLAGLRLGMAFASSAIIGILNKIKAPYNLNRYAQAFVLQALEGTESMELRRDQLLEQRQILENRLLESSLVEKVYPSEANFLLVRFKDSRRVFRALLDKGIIIRDRSSQVVSCLRITIGTPVENQKLLEELNFIENNPIAAQS